ncbi:MAG: undecaprenyldiphospho-muramoylpentapeptide beta-N-acetylglucosaminyltransferase [Acidobacteriota bacterium]
MTLRASNASAPETQPATAGPLALVTGGGSGGHVFPGLAICEELVRRGWQVGWVGSRRGLEARLVDGRDIPFHDLPARPVVGQSLAGKLRAALTLVRSAWQARALVRRSRAQVVVGTGGYVSAPAVFGAWLAARPTYLLEPNADAGFANRWLSRLAAEAGVAFEGTRSQLACPARTTGIPVRDEFFNAESEPPPSPPVRLLILGGSQGARQINELMPPALVAVAERLGAIEVCHQTGRAHLDATRDAYRAAGIEPRGASENDESAPTSSEAPGEQSVRCEIVPFIGEIATAMARSHLIVSRAGAITLAEICAVGRASLLVPLAIAAGHQGANAERLEAAGAARVLPASATASDLTELLADLLREPQTLPVLGDMARAARDLGHRSAVQAIAERLELLAGLHDGDRREGAS